MNQQWNEKLANLGEKLGQFSQAIGQKVSELGPVEEQIKALKEHFEGFIQKQVQKATQHTLKQVPVKIKLLENFSGALPAYESDGASGFDVRAQLAEELVLQPGERFLVPTGLSLEIPPGYEIQARPRSGLAVKRGLGMVNSPGTIDADYRGEIKIIAINLSQEPITIQTGERIAQLVLCPIYQAEFLLVEELGTTQRGAGGFGHTGV